MTNSLSSIFKSVKNVAITHSPELLLALGISGLITSNILTAQGTIKAVKVLNEKKKEKKVETLPVKEVIELSWKYYIWSTIVGGVSILCLVKMNSDHKAANAALALAYSIKDSASTAYRNKTIEMVGEKKEQSIREAVAKEKLDKTPITNQEIYVTKSGQTLCFDTISGRYFKADIEAIKQAENKLNYQLRNDIYICLNEFYDLLGLEPVKMGESLGWNIDKGYLEITYSAQLSSDNEPCLVLDYSVAPMYDFKTS